MSVSIDPYTGFSSLLISSPLFLSSSLYLPMSSFIIVVLVNHLHNSFVNPFPLSTAVKDKIIMIIGTHSPIVDPIIIVAVHFFKSRPPSITSSHKEQSKDKSMSEHEGDAACDRGNKDWVGSIC